MPNFDEGFYKICDDPKFAFINFEGALTDMAFKCHVLLIPTPLFKIYDALALRDNSPYKSIFYRM